MGAYHVDEAQLREVVAERAREFGHKILPANVVLDLLEGEVAPGCRVFRASYGPGEVEGAVSGLLEEGELPDTWPQRAVSKLFQRWLDVDGRISDPMRAAIAAAFLYDPAGLSDVILSETDADRLVGDPEHRSAVELPHFSTLDGAPGLVFWWVNDDGLSEIRFHLDSEGEVWTSERSL